MVAFYQILLPLLSLFLVRVDLTDLFPLHIEVQLHKIYDGDTVLVKHGSYSWKVRFSKIDSPEKSQSFLGSRASAGIYSKNCLHELLNKEGLLTLKIEKEDIYGRILGDLNQISLKLIEAGCTTIYPHARFDSKEEKFLYLKALKIAKASRRGLWQYGGFMQPKYWRKFSKRSARRQYHR